MKYQTHPNCEWIINEWESLIKNSSVIKRSSKREIFQCGKELCIKRIHYKWSKRFLHIFFKNPAEKYWLNAHILKTYSIDVPAPYALINTKHFSLLFLKWIEGELLCDFIAEKYTLLTKQQQEVFIDQLAHFIGKIHFEEGIYHEDLTAENIIVTKEGEGFRCVLLDIDRIKYYFRAVPEDKRIKNLSQLGIYICNDVKLKHGLNFLKKYNSMHRNPKNLKQLYHAIMNQMQKRTPRAMQHICSKGV